MPKARDFREGGELRDIVAACSFATQMHQTFLDGSNPVSEDDHDRMFEEAYAVADCWDDASSRLSRKLSELVELDEEMEEMEDFLPSPTDRGLPPSS